MKCNSALFRVNLTTCTGSEGLVVMDSLSESVPGEGGDTGGTRQTGDLSGELYRTAEAGTMEVDSVAADKPAETDTGYSSSHPSSALSGSDWLGVEVSKQMATPHTSSCTTDNTSGDISQPGAPLQASTPTKR